MDVYLDPVTVRNLLLITSTVIVTTEPCLTHLPGKCQILPEGIRVRVIAELSRNPW